MRNRPLVYTGGGGARVRVAASTSTRPTHEEASDWLRPLPLQPTWSREPKGGAVIATDARARLHGARTHARAHALVTGFNLLLL